MRSTRNSEECHPGRASTAAGGLVQWRLAGTWAAVEGADVVGGGAQQGFEHLVQCCYS
jgi:hypothetical protein